MVGEMKLVVSSLKRGLCKYTLDVVVSKETNRTLGVLVNKEADRVNPIEENVEMKIEITPNYTPGTLQLD